MLAVDLFTNSNRSANGAYLVWKNREGDKGRRNQDIQQSAHAAFLEFPAGFQSQR